MEELLKTIFIPFEIKDQFNGFAQSSGILKFNDGCIVCEFQTKDSILGLLKSAVKEIRIPVSGLIDLEYKKKIFGGRIFIRTNSMEYTSYFPGLNSYDICLKIEKKSRENARQLVSAVTLMISENNLRTIDQ